MAADDARDRQIKAHFLEVVDLDAEARRAYLEEKCPADLRAEVEELLRLNDETGDEFERPAFESLEGEAPGEPEFGPLDSVEEFQIVRKIGEGGMGVVYLARDSVLERLVALKVLPSVYTSSEQRLARFKHEAITVAQLKHPGIVQVHRVGEANGVFFLAMDYVAGTNLEVELEKRRVKRKEGFERVNRGTEYLREQARLLADVSDALDYVHRHEIIHRDIKPSNILINEEGRPLLTDFGVAKNLRQESLSTPGQLAGTYAYMSPEQARAAEASRIDHRSDVFSLGVVLYEALSLERPFGGKTHQQIVQEVTTKQPRPLRALNPGVGKDLETICQKALEKEPMHRYQSAAHLAADLRAWVRGDPILAQPPSIARRTRALARRHRVAAGVAVALALGVSAGGLGVAWLSIERARCTLLVTAPDSVEDRAPSAATATFIPLVWRNAGGTPEERPGEGARSVRIGLGQDHAQSLAPGAYWVRVESDEGWFAESPLMLRRGERDRVSMRLAPPDETPADMALIPATDGAPPFWIDKHEVSNAEFRGFLLSLPEEQRAALRPRWWGDAYDDRLDELPVTGVTWEAAARYAASVGRRLPTAREWDRAVAGDDDRPFPWGDAEPVSCYANTGGDNYDAFLSVDSDTPEASMVRAFNSFVDSVRPVTDPYPPPRPECGEDPEGARRDQTPLGVVNLYANVAEWTASTPPPREATRDVRLLYRAVKGESWATRPGPDPGVRGLASSQARVQAQVLGLGFRCARSGSVGGRVASPFDVPPPSAGEEQES